MTPARTAPRLRHDALLYGSDGELLAAVIPFIREGLARDHAVVAAVTRANITLLRDELGAEADAVSFIDRDDWYQRAGATIAGWRRLLAEATARGHDQLRIVGEVAFGAAPGRHRTWTRYESALNSVFADAPAWIVCPYDARTLPPTVLSDARRTHPTLLGGDAYTSDRYEDPAELLRTMPEQVPDIAGPPAVELAATDCATARRAVRAAARSWRLRSQQYADVIIVTSELVANAIRHGKGRRVLRLWVDRHTVVGEVSDEGPGPTDPLAGYQPPPDVAVDGWGLWIARQACDALAIDRQPALTRIRFTIHPTGPSGAR